MWGCRQLPFTGASCPEARLRPCPGLDAVSTPLLLLVQMFRCGFEPTGCRLTHRVSVLCMPAPGSGSSALGARGVLWPP